MTSFFDLQVLGVLRTVEENKRHFWNHEEFLCQKDVFYGTIFIWNFDLIWPDLDLTSVKSQVKWRHKVKESSLSISMCKMTQKTFVSRHVFYLYFMETFCELTLTLTFLAHLLGGGDALRHPTLASLLNNLKTSADIETKLAVPYTALIWDIHTKFQRNQS